MTAAAPAVELEVEGRTVRVSNPDKVFFPVPGITKLDLVQYFLAVADGALTGSRSRPCLLLRFPNGIDAKPFFQKRVPESRPDWIQTASIKFPSGRRAEMLVMADAAHLVWAANLGCIGIDPWPVRLDDVDHPDELRFDLDPTPGVDFADVRRTAMVVRNVLAEHHLIGFPKTSGKRGMHVWVRIDRKHGFKDVRRAGIAAAREIESRIPDIATTAWWKEERHGVFLDYNQNARDRTTASAYSVRAVANAQVSAPLTWDEVETAEPGDFTVATVPARFSKLGDPGAGIDETAGSIESLLELSDRQEKEGMEKPPLPPHFPKEKGEPTRVAPSRRRKPKR
jgi:DNA ligase D